MDKTERRRKFIINVIFWGIIAAFLIFFIRKFINVLMPFVIAAIVAMIIKPVAKWASRKLRVPRKAAAIVCVIIFYLLLCGVLLLIASSLVNFVKDTAAKVPSWYYNTVEPAVHNVANYIKEISDGALNINFDAVTSEVLTSLASMATSLSGKLLGWVTTVITNVPGLLLNILICVIATLFMAADWTHVSAFVKAQIPGDYISLMSNIRSHFRKVIKSYARSYLLILSITFCEVFLGITLFGYNHTLIIALCVAIVDILPVLGCGTVMIPWALITALSGNFMRGLALFLLWCIITVVRNYIEPRIIGKHVGLHPIVTLMSMVVGTYIFGGIGLFGLPISIAVLVSLREGGILKLYNDPPPVDD